MQIPRWLTIPGVIVSGHCVASGQAPDNPYPNGTITMQTPFFRDRGLDLSSFFPGTLNVSIAPYRFQIREAAHCFRNVKWSPSHAAEDFSFFHCNVHIESLTYAGWIYYPHPETKLGHFQDPSTLELLLPPIPGIQYGDRLYLQVSPDELQIDPVPAQD